MKPNIVLILADDLGYSDLGAYGGEIRTPVLDELARGGVRHSSFYNTARCSPSRASLLTGRHPHETGIGVLTRPDAPLGYPGDLGEDCETIAATLGQAGWSTWLSGKWHLSANTETPNSSWPTRRGFDRFFGTLAGCGSFYTPQTLMRGELPADDAITRPDFYYTDAISDEAAGWIAEHTAAEAENPYFLYLAYTAPHWPLHAPESDIQAYDGVYDAGWDTLRERRVERLIEEGLLNEGSTLSERDPSQPAWADAGDKAWNARRMQTYAAQVSRMDAGIGRVLEAIDRSGERENTIVIFVSDNGASAEELPIGKMATFMQKDTAMTSPTRSGETVRIGNDSSVVPGPDDTYASYGVPWANLSNTPLRMYKRWVHEGGISTPFLVSWPAANIAEGEIVHTPFQLVDVVPTLLEAAGIQPSAGVPRPYAGRSMLAAWRGQPVEEVPLYWEHIGNAAVREGRFKLVRDHPAGWELYDIEQDRIESHNLADENPEIVDRLAKRWQQWADSVGVISWDRMLADYEVRGLTPEAAEE